MKVQCPTCQGTFRVEGHETGTTFDCPYCQIKFSFRDRDTLVASDAPDTPIPVEFEREEGTSGNNPSPLKSVEMDSPSSSAPSSSPSSTPSRDDVTRLLSSSGAQTPIAPPEELTDLRLGDVILGYRLQEVIGSGGMSVVFRATQESLNRDVAFKVMRKDLAADPEFAERFRTEARALAELSHPNIVAVFDQGELDGCYFLIMEFIDGVSLRDVMEDHRLSPEEALKIVPDLCSALEYAHSKDIIHRDIKPENILLDRKGIPRIADFGLVRIVGESAPATRLTKTQAVLGTYDYMAPEQREGSRDVDHRADIYSLGVVLYEMLTGELPIARFPKPSERADLNHGIDEVVLKVLEKDRERRYQRASFVARDLTRAQTGHSAGHSARNSGQHPEHDPMPKSFVGRIVAMSTSFSFFFFSAIFTTILIVAHRDEEVLCLAGGIAIPFYLGQLILNGLLPRPVVREKNFIVRHPVISFGLLTALTAAIASDSRHNEEPGLFFAGLWMSCGILIWCWRRKIFRASSAEPAFDPWAGPPDGYEALRNGRLPQGARQAVGRAAGYARTLAEQSRMAIEKHHAERRRARQAAAGSPPVPPPPPPPPSAGTPVSVHSAAAEHPTSDSAISQAPERPFSWSTLFAFLIMLPVILVTIAIGVLVLGFDGMLAPLQMPMNFREVANFFSGLWQLDMNDIGNIFTALAILPPLLLAPPFILLFFGLPGILSRKKRGAPLYLTTAVIFAVELMVLVGVSIHINDVGNQYRFFAGQQIPSNYHERQQHLIDGLEQAVVTTNELERVALYHRTIRIANNVSAIPLEARTPLILIATDPGHLTNVRIGALMLLDRLFGAELFDEPELGNTPPGWVDMFKYNARNRELDYRMRTAFERTVQRSY